ncbi:MAG: hypothetical protein Q8K05_15910 [Polaromonas sp.]|uniref:COG4648 family protein n=1 Tax=Polaromonas sp. TaxID=1869339 RepID=UPI002731AC4F|nr:hypothetical protein [Polaromonas sp.]MDP2257509.1 hypothetical protein [Polaromonas sp.]
MLGTAYAVLSHWAAASAEPDLLDALVAIVPPLGLGFVMAWRSPRRAVGLALFLAACAALYGISGWLVAHYNWVFLLQHAGVYALLCVAFGRTLQGGQTPMISRFARIVHGELSPSLIRYTRSATWAWAFYFGGIAGLSLLLFWLAPVPLWSAFANLLGIPLLVLMFAGEYAVRCYVLPAAERAGPLDAIRAYRQASAEGAARRP